MSNRKQKAETTTEPAIVGNIVVAAVPYQCCPLCNGNGQTVADGFTSSVYQTCKVCNGARIIPMHIVDWRFSTGFWANDDRRDEDEVRQSTQTDAKPNVICRAAFKGEVTNEQYDIVMKYIKDMQERGWTWAIAYTEGRNENLYIDYVVEKHGI